VDANFDHLENYNSLARRELALLEVLARLTGDVIERGRSELFSRYEKAIRDYETRFQATFENAAVGIANVTPDGRWLRANKALCRILGYSAEELITKSFQDITHPDDLAADLAQVELMRDGKINSYEMDKRYLRKDGAIVWVRRTIGCVRKSDGSIDYLVSVVEDISAHKRAEDELRKSEERFRSSLVHSPLPIALFDEQEQILAVSESWIEQSGYSREELRRVEDWTTRAFGEHSDEVLQVIRRVMQAWPAAHSGEHTIRTKDGRERLWTFVASPLGPQSVPLGPQSEGQHVYVIVAQDVTERRAHKEQVQLLLREVSHRSKNMLSVVEAIAHQTASREPEDFIGRFSERVQALAASQDLLVQNEWRGVDVGDLVRAQLAHFGDFIGSRIVVNDQKLRLNAAAAQGIGLALHELATNAGKYGALSTNNGRVDIGWGTDGDSLIVSWTESDGPSVSPPKRRGFGSMVVEAMAARSVDGAVHLDYPPSGLTWRLSCPAANALERGV
jgi:PAS domain S-box-containing protein